MNDGKGGKEAVYAQCLEATGRQNLFVTCPLMLYLLVGQVGRFYRKLPRDNFVGRWVGKQGVQKLVIEGVAGAVAMKMATDAGARQSQITN